MDAISITGLTATGFHGVFPEERLNGQRFVVDVELGLHVETRSDELSDTVDYAGIADRCLSNSLVQQVRVTVHKPQAPVPHELSDLSVTITRSSHEQRSL